MKTIAIVNLKGGVGKTVTSINLGVMMAEGKKRTLIIDNDSQGNIATFFDVEKNSRNENVATTADLLRNGDQPTIRAAIQKTKYENLFVIAGGEDMEGINIELANQPPMIRYTKFRNALQYIKNDFDIIIIDNNPNMTTNVINSFLVADDIIVPMEVDIFSVKGLTRINKQINQAKKVNKNIKMAGVLLTRVNAICKRKNKEVLEELQSKKYPVFETMIHSSERVKDSINDGIPLVNYKNAKNIRPARDYRNLYQEYIGK